MAAPHFNALIVADDPAHAELVNGQLTSASAAASLARFTVDTATRSQAPDALARTSYDVIVFCPPRDGADLDHVRELLSDARAIPVVISMATFAVDFAVQALTLGAEDVLSDAETCAALLPRASRYAVARRKAQGALQAALKEKEVLLHELHHRAKNNLQVISGLLNMQARRDRDPRFREIVATAQQRIDAIALAHDTLHQSPDLSRIDFSAYLGALARAVHVSYGGETRGITVDLAVEPCELPLQDAVPTGLVANELLMNAFKHAFPDGRSGVVRLSASRRDERFALEVADDGVGLPSGTANDPRRLGLEIVATLAEQLDASLEHHSGPGTTFRLSFTSSEKP